MSLKDGFLCFFARFLVSAMPRPYDRLSCRIFDNSPTARLMRAERAPAAA